LKGIRYPHGWVEDGDIIIDCSKKFQLPRELYYRLGNIKAEEIRRYSGEELMSQIEKYEHW